MGADEEDAKPKDYIECPKGLEEVRVRGLLDGIRVPAIEERHGAHRQMRKSHTDPLQLTKRAYPFSHHAPHTAQ